MYNVLLTWNDRVIGGTDSEETAKERLELFRFYDEYNGIHDFGTYAAIDGRTGKTILTL